MGNIKDYREKELKSYIIANILVLLLCLNIFDISSDVTSLVELLSVIFNSSIISSSIYIFSFLTDSLISSNTKEKLIYFGTALPGEKIFTAIKEDNKDKRFSFQQAAIKYKHIYDMMPEDKKCRKKFENAEWYSIYSKYKSKDMIYHSNRDYLLCRDIYIATFTIFISYIITGVFTNFVQLTYKCVIFELVMLFVCNVATRQKAKRFAYNVIAEDIQNVEN